VRFLDPRRLPFLLGLGIAAAPLLRSMIVYFFPTQLKGALVLMPCRTDSLLLGVAGAWLMRSKHRSWLERHPKAHWFALSVFLAGAAVLTYHAHRSAVDLWIHTVGLTWIALLYLTVILLAVNHPGSWLAGCFRWRWLRGLGAIAYGLYLAHQLILSVVVYLVPRFFMTLTAALLATALSLVICWVSWRYFEKPLVEYSHRLKRPFFRAVNKQKPLLP
jgi:peptidoglycan/LPS O-acetylase OafA/YrhL